MNGCLGTDVHVHCFSLSSLCQRYDDIATKVYGDPQNTEDMVELDKFLTNVWSWEQLSTSHNDCCVSLSCAVP